MSDHDNREAPLWANLTGRLVSTGYHERSNVDARRRTIASFSEHLTGTTGLARATAGSD